LPDPGPPAYVGNRFSTATVLARGQSAGVSARKGKTATPKVRRPQGELENALRLRYRFLTKSAAAYDAGDQEKAVRMSVDLRALLHYGSSLPLLHELGRIKRIEFADSCPDQMTPPDGSQVVWMQGGGLTVMSFVWQNEDGSGSGKLVPRCSVGDGDEIRWSKYTPWWKSDLVVTSEDGKRHSRLFVVTQMANSEGAHTDAYLEGDYQALQPRASGWTITGPDGVPHVAESDVAGASVRQVTWEVLRTLEEKCGDLLG